MDTVEPATLSRVEPQPETVGSEAGPARGGPIWDDAEFEPTIVRGRE
jgi:hypothetical protein